MSLSKINIRELLNFFDAAPPESTGHASALVGIAGEELCATLLQKHLKENCDYKDAVIPMKNGKPLTPTLGTKQGKRLDRWLLATNRAGEIDLFQIEIKNWSAHAIGGERISPEASADDLKEIGRRYWRKIWSEERKEFNHSNAGKVLVRMKLPDGYEIYIDRVAPLLCFWWYITDPKSNDNRPFFEYSIDDTGGGFKRFFVFSVSNYLRLLLASGHEDVELDMPQTAQRMAWIKRIFGTSFT